MGGVVMVVSWGGLVAGAALVNIVFNAMDARTAKRQKLAENRLVEGVEVKVDVGYA